MAVVGPGNFEMANADRSDHSHSSGDNGRCRVQAIAAANHLHGTESAYSMCSTRRGRSDSALDEACRSSGRMAKTPPAGTMQSTGRL